MDISPKVIKDLLYEQVMEYTKNSKLTPLLRDELCLTDEEEVDIILEEAGGLPPFVHVEDVS